MLWALQPPISPRIHMEHSICGLGLGWNLHVAPAKTDFNLQALGWAGQSSIILEAGKHGHSLERALWGVQPVPRKPLCVA